MSEIRTRFLNERKTSRSFKVVVEIVEYDEKEQPRLVQRMSSELIHKETAELIFQSCRRIVQ